MEYLFGEGEVGRLTMPRAGPDEAPPDATAAVKARSRYGCAMTTSGLVEYQSFIREVATPSATDRDASDGAICRNVRFARKQV